MEHPPTQPTDARPSAQAAGAPPSDPLPAPAPLSREILRLALDGAGLTALAQALAEQVARTVIVENRFGQVLAAAGPSASPVAAPPEAPGIPAWARRRLGAGQMDHPEILRISDPPACLATPIVALRDVVGYLSVLEGCHPLPSDAHVPVEQAALAFAVEFVRQHAALDAELRLKGNLLDVLLLDERGSASLAVLRSSLVGYDLSRPQTLLVVGIDPPSNDGDPSFTPRHLAEILVPWLRREHPMSLIAEKDGAAVVLLARAGSSGRRRTHRAEPEFPADWRAPLGTEATDLVESLRREVALVAPGTSLSVAVTAPVAWRDLRRAYRLARRAYAALRLLGHRGQTVSTTDPRLAVFLLLDGTEAEILHEFVEIVLGPLLAYDEQHGRDLVATLDAYLAGEGHLETIARALQIHTSTLKYRLRRIGEISGLDLHSPDHRFNAALALKLRGMIPRSSPNPTIRDTFEGE